MKKVGKVLLITGPLSSGKSTLARYISTKMKWECLSEDNYWVQNKWDAELRTVERETAIQEKVFNDLLALSKTGKDVVLEFILYKGPPNPLTAYQKLLYAHSLPFTTIVLKPSVEEIIRRLNVTGRAIDTNNLTDMRKNVENQVRCTEADYIDPRWVIDSTNMTVKELCDKSLELMGSQLG